MYRHQPCLHKRNWSPRRTIFGQNQSKEKSNLGGGEIIGDKKIGDCPYGKEDPEQAESKLWETLKNPWGRVKGEKG